MVKTFIVISLILHAITLYVVYYLYRQTETLRQLNLQDVKELLESTLITIQEENKRLQHSLRTSQIKVDSVHENKDTSEFSPLVTKNTQNSKSDPVKASAMAYTTQSESTADDLIKQEIDQTDTYKPSIQGQVLQLHEKGHSIEQIAQALNCGKTEVDLILRFHENKGI